MEMRAYSYDYLITAQRIMGDMLDFAVNTCDMDVDRYLAMFLVSDISVQFQNGNPTSVYRAIRRMVQTGICVRI